MNVRDLIDRARNGNDYACGALYAICDGDPVKLTELGEDIATAVNDAHERALARHSSPVRAEEIAEYARLTAAREGRRASFMSDRISMDEARARAMREGHAFTDPADYDSEWKRNVVALNPHSEEYRRLKHAPADTSVVDAFTDYDLNT